MNHSPFKWALAAFCLVVSLTLFRVALIAAVIVGALWLNAHPDQVAELRAQLGLIRPAQP